MVRFLLVTLDTGLGIVKNMRIRTIREVVCVFVLLVGSNVEALNKEPHHKFDPTVLTGGLHVPSDGDAKAWKAAGALALKAIETGGAEFYGNILVRDIELDQGRTRAVVTDQGRIECEQVLLCTNIWGSVLADKVGVMMPMMAGQGKNGTK